MDADHLVVIGDARKMRELPSESVQLIITSPPHANFTLRSAKTGFSRDINDYICGLLKVFRECRRVLKNGHFLCINIRDSISNLEKMPIPAHLLFALSRSGFRFCEDVFWGQSKNSKNLSLDAFITPDFQVQRTLVFRKGENARHHLLISKMGWDAPGELSPPDDSAELFQNFDARAHHLHPDAFSEQLLEALILQFTVEGDTVLDPFLGNGILSRVAAHLHRNSVGYDSNGYHIRNIRQQAGIPDGHLKVVFREEGRLT